MIAAAFFALALAGAGELGAQTGGEVSARLRTEPAEVEVGQPVRWILEVDHPAGAAVRLPEGEPLPDDSWVLLEPRTVLVAPPTASGGGFVTTRATWSVMSFEPGERKLPTLAIQVEVDGEARTIETEPATISVRSALQPGEDAPRPIRGFHDAPAGASGGRTLVVAIALTALALLASIVGAILWRRSRRKPAPAAAPTALERLAEIRKNATADPESSRKVVYALTALLRESADRFLGEDRAALADSEWVELREKDERLPLGVRSTFVRVLRDSERVKYALHAPTRFALEEMLADAGNALEALASAPKPAAAAASLGEAA